MTAIASTRITPAAQVTAGLDSPKRSDAAGAGGAICWESRMAMANFAPIWLQEKGLFRVVAGLERRHVRLIYRLDQDARAELDHTIGRDVEVIGDVARVARHGGEDALAPQRHASRADSGHHSLARDEERGLHRVDLQAERAAMLERASHIRTVHEAVAHAHAPAVVAQPLAD